jgi:hypothetical protein
MSQLHLDWTDNAAQLERVGGRIAGAVLAFCRAYRGQTFHLEALMEFVREIAGVAPDSPGRILRNLRQRGFIDYEVVSRPKSLYRMQRVRG